MTDLLDHCQVSTIDEPEIEGGHKNPCNEKCRCNCPNKVVAIISGGDDSTSDLEEPNAVCRKHAEDFGPYYTLTFVNGGM